MIHGYSNGASIAMVIMMVAFTALIVAAIVWAIRSNGPRERSPEISAAELLDRRLASEEISAQEYGRLRAIMDRGDSDRARQETSSPDPAG